MSTAHTLTLIAQGNPFTPLFSTLAGLVAAAVAALMGAVVGIATLVLVARLLKALIKNPSWESLAVLVGIACFAVMLAGASPGLLRASFAWGKTLGDGTAAADPAALTVAEGGQ